MKNKPEYCKVTGKYIYSSEAKATRAVEKYDDIVRCYYCHNCGGFHTTSQEKENPEPRKREYSPQQIQRAINRLQKIIDQKEQIKNE